MCGQPAEIMLIQGIWSNLGQHGFCFRLETFIKVRKRKQTKILGRIICVGR